MASILDTFAVYCHTHSPVYWLMTVCTGIASMPKLRAAKHGRCHSDATGMRFLFCIAKKCSSGDRKKAWFKLQVYSILVKFSSAPVYWQGCPQQYTDCKLFVPVCKMLVTSRLLEDATTASESPCAYFVIDCWTVCVNIVFHSSKPCPFSLFWIHSTQSSILQIFQYAGTNCSIRHGICRNGRTGIQYTGTRYVERSILS
jgi:hypothetical protein